MVVQAGHPLHARTQSMPVPREPHRPLVKVANEYETTAKWVESLPWLPAACRPALIHGLENEAYVCAELIHALTEEEVVRITLTYEVPEWKPVFTRHLLTSAKHLMP